eukprot:1340673-Amorphochlora_amoeboformis.AAC.1
MGEQRTEDDTSDVGGSDGNGSRADDPLRERNNYLQVCGGISGHGSSYGSNQERRMSRCWKERRFKGQC